MGLAIHYWAARAAVAVTSIWLALLMAGIAVDDPGIRPERTAFIYTRLFRLCVTRHFTESGAPLPPDLPQAELMRICSDLPPNDPWGKPYRYVTVGGAATIQSLGADRRSDSCDDITPDSFHKACYPDPSQRARITFWGSVFAWTAALIWRSRVLRKPSTRGDQAP